ncbi:hypothetical protein GDO78_018181 [Eleutherodactylus coqui]|uniref:Uncharacterized protein n=1 Tax=Eleutherodactylus coqui TaxID=57060 RepID=A0A8J6BKV1_ELECQ|nr:hypothetical protein GDO78_018181 [Eleutherodactylus coqui]
MEQSLPLVPRCPSERSSQLSGPFWSISYPAPFHRVLSEFRSSNAQRLAEVDTHRDSGHDLLALGVSSSPGIRDSSSGEDLGSQTPGSFLSLCVPLSLTFCPSGGTEILPRRT